MLICADCASLSTRDSWDAKVTGVANPGFSGGGGEHWRPKANFDLLKAKVKQSNTKVPHRTQFGGQRGNGAQLVCSTTRTLAKN